MQNDIKLNTLDDAYRLLLPASVRNTVGFNPGDTLRTTTCEDGKTIRLEKATEATDIAVDNLGRIKLPKALRQTMGFCTGNRFNVMPSCNGNGITLVCVS